MTSLVGSSLVYRELGTTGLRLSLLSLGGSGYGGLYGEYNEKEAERTINLALDKGINYIDTSPFYGEGGSESFLGKTLSKIPRDRYFIGTKVGRYFWDVKKRFDFSSERITCSFEESLKRLQLDHIDILQLHDIEFAPSKEIILHEALPAIQKLKEKGKCRAIGITGYPLQPLKDIVMRSHVHIDSVLSYCRLSLNDNSLCEHFDFFKNNNVSLINASPISLGLLSENGVQWWHPATDEIKSICRTAVEYCVSQGVDITRLAINHSTSFDQVVTTLVAVSDVPMLEKNINAVCQPLSKKEKEVKEKLKEHFFSKLSQPHWEGIELIKYNNELKQ